MYPSVETENEEDKKKRDKKGKGQDETKNVVAESLRVLFEE